MSDSLLPCSSSTSSTSDCCESTKVSSECTVSDLYTCHESKESCTDNKCGKKKSHKKKNSSSSSSSGCCSSSSDCGQFDCKAFRKPRKSVVEPVRTVQKYNASEIYAHFKAAVVNVTGVANVTGSDEPLNYSGNGFFVTKKHFIVCPAHLVVLAPSVAPARIPPPDPNTIALVNNIFVTVFNINGTDKSAVYNARVIGVDGAGDIAVLRLINNDCSGAKKLKNCHPYLKLGNSLKYSVGNKVYSIGTQYSRDFRSVTEGIVRNNKYLDNAGNLAYEIMSTTLPYNMASRVTFVGEEGGFALTDFQAPDGAPILDVTGRVVGMVTIALNIVVDPTTGSPIFSQANSDNYAAGVSERFMRCVLKALIKSYCKQSEQSNTILVTDFPLGVDFYSYQKGFLGIASTIVDDRFYAGLNPFGVATGATGAECRSILGTVIDAVPGTGGTGAVGVAGVVNVGDILTHIDCIEVGNLPDQLVPALYNWRKRAGECTRLTFRSASTNYNGCYESKITYIGYPTVADYSPQLYNFIGEVEAQINTAKLARKPRKGVQL